MAAPDQLARKPAAAQTAHTGEGVGDPGEGADGFDIEAAGIVEILGEPEEIEVPGGIAEELRGNESPDLRKGQEPEPLVGGARMVLGVVEGLGDAGAFRR